MHCNWSTLPRSSLSYFPFLSFSSGLLLISSVLFFELSVVLFLVLSDFLLLAFSVVFLLVDSAAELFLVFSVFSDTVALVFSDGDLRLLFSSGAVLLLLTVVVVVVLLLSVEVFLVSCGLSCVRRRRLVCGGLVPLESVKDKVAIERILCSR